MEKNKYNEFIYKIVSWNNKIFFNKVVVWFYTLYSFLIVIVLSWIGNWVRTYTITLFLALMMGITYTTFYIHQYIDVVGKNGKNVQNLLDLNLPIPHFVEEYYDEIEQRMRKKIRVFIFVFTIGVFLAQMINWFRAFSQVVCLTATVVILLLLVCAGSLRYYRWRIKSRN